MTVWLKQREQPAPRKAGCCGGCRAVHVLACQDEDYKASLRVFCGGRVCLGVGGSRRRMHIGAARQVGNEGECGMGVALGEHAHVARHLNG